MMVILVAGVHFRRHEKWVRRRGRP
jgi:hypothetical protein